MNSSWNHIRLAMLALAVGLGTGCSGINAGKSFSPMDFILPGYGLPGLMQNKPASPPIPGPIPSHDATATLALAD